MMKFTIGFEKEDLKKLHNYWDEIIQSQQWLEGKFTQMFEEKWKLFMLLHSIYYIKTGNE